MFCLTRNKRRDNMKLTSQEGDFTYGRDGVKTKVKELRTAAGMTQQQLAERGHVSDDYFH